MLKKRLIPYTALAIMIASILFFNQNVFSENNVGQVSAALITDKKVFKHTKYQIPKDFTNRYTHGISFHGTSFDVKLFARDFAQGVPVYIEIIANKNIDPDQFQAAGIYANKTIPLSKTEWGYRGIFAIPPTARTGLEKLTVLAGPKGNVSEARALFYVAKSDFPRYNSSMDLGKYSNTSALTNETLVFIKECQKKKKKAFSIYTNHLRVSNKVSHPRDMHKITSPFYATRVVSKYKMNKGKKITLKPSVSVHRGLDLRGLVGEPIYAIADGKVILSEKMYYEGNLTLIDHGNGIMSTYMHQDSLLVEKDEVVSAGQKIGTVGATGAVTGSHLHISLYIRGIPVDPLGLLSLPLRN
ncbi:MAG: M23 family metallopeptidase [Spirochaetia bacterium]|nr:M23 family metallopeptidase [Spirochaetia bacterium]